jgi:hypothetical protein
MLLAYSGNVKIGKKSPYEYAAAVFEVANRHEPGGVDWTRREVARELGEQGEAD